MWGTQLGVGSVAKEFGHRKSGGPSRLRASELPHCKLSAEKAGVILVYSRRVREACWACYI